MVKVFVDRCLPESIATALSKVPGVHAIRLEQVYGPQDVNPTMDVVWLAECGQRGWIAVTKNFRIGRVETEIDAIKMNGTQVFTLKRADWTREENGLVLGRHILRLMRRNRREGACFWRLGLESVIKEIP